MGTHDMQGEPLEQAGGAFVESLVFQGIKAYRIIGAKEQVKATTDMLSVSYGVDTMITLGDAACIGRSGTVDIYELIVLRKLNESECQTAR